MTGRGVPPGRMAGKPHVTPGPCHGHRSGLRGGGRPGRALRHRGPRRRPGRLRRRAVRRRGRAEHRAWWRRAASAGPACTGDASRRRSCSRRPRSCAPSAGATEFGVDAGGADARPRPRSQARKQEVVDRLTKGLETLLKGRKVTVVQGPARSSTPPGTACGSPTAPRSPGDNLVDRHRLAPRVAARPRLRRHAHPLVRSRARAHRGPAASRDHRRRCDRLRVRVDARRHGQRGHGARGAAAHPRPADAEVGRRRRPLVQEARASTCRPACASPASRRARADGHAGRPTAGSTSVDGRQDHRERRPRGRCSEGSGSRPPASSVDDRGYVVVDDQLRTTVARRVRRRRRRRHAAARARRLRRGDRRDQDHPRRAGPPPSTTTRCRGACTAIPRSRSCGLTEEQARRARARGGRRCTGSPATPGP